jgi:hypothetical protein
MWSKILQCKMSWNSSGYQMPEMDCINELQYECGSINGLYNPK